MVEGLSLLVVDVEPIRVTVLVSTTVCVTVTEPALLEVELPEWFEFRPPRE